MRKVLQVSLALLAGAVYGNDSTNLDLTLDSMIDTVQEKKGGTDYQYFDLLGRISFHETAQTLNPKMYQYEDGPGRGLYMCEKGNGAAGRTAINRLENFCKKNHIEIPQWVKDLEGKESIDFSKLTARQQSIAILADYMEKPKADLSKVFNGEQKLENFWLQYHWAGSEKEKEKRRSSWKESMSEYDNDDYKKFYSLLK